MIMSFSGKLKVANKLKANSVPEDKPRASMWDKFKAAKSVLENKSGASMWEYLLVIAIVCVIGAALLAVINGEGGISSMWQGLVNKFSQLLNIGTGT